MLPVSTALAQHSICDENPEEEDGAGWGWANNKTRAQTFVASSSYNVYSIALSLAKNCSCTGTLTVSLRNTDGTYPTNELSSKTLDFAQVGCDWSWVEFALPSPISLTSGTRYAIAVSVSTSYCVYWRTGYFNYPAYDYVTEWGYAPDSFTFRIYGDCPPPPGVGGELYPVDKLAVIVPWITLTAIIGGGIGVLLIRRRAHKQI